MNVFEKWFKEVEAGGREGQDRAAMLIAAVLTAIVAYFLIMYWYTQFLRATGSAPAETVEAPTPSFLETVQTKVTNFFKNEQVVE